MRVTGLWSNSRSFGNLLGLFHWTELLLNLDTRICKRNPLLLDSQLSFGEEEAVGALLFGAQVGEGGGAVAGVGDGEVLEFGDGGGVHEQ